MKNEKPGYSCDILTKLNLDDQENLLKETCTGENGPGRPPSKTAGIFKALAVNRFLQIPRKIEPFRPSGKTKSGNSVT